MNLAIQPLEKLSEQDEISCCDNKAEQSEISLLIVILFSYNISNELGWKFWKIGIPINAVVHPITKVRRAFIFSILLS